MSNMLHTVPAAAKTLGVSERFCWQLVHTGRLGHIKLGRLTKISDSQIAEFVTANTKPAIDFKAAARKVLRGRD